MRNPVTYLVNKKGKKTAVQLSISEWNRLLKERRRLLEYAKMKMGLAEAVEEIRLVESGRRKPRTLGQFLNAL